MKNNDIRDPYSKRVKQAPAPGSNLDTDDYTDDAPEEVGLLDDDVQTYSDPEEEAAYQELLRELEETSDNAKGADRRIQMGLQQDWMTFRRRLRAEGYISTSAPLTYAEDDDARRYARVSETKPVFPRWIGWSAAAAVALIIGLTSVLREQSGFTEQTEMVASIADYQIITTGDNTKQVKLSDGSALHLNRHTTIKVDNNSFGKKYRDVWIEDGEVFFEVAKNPEKPFIVHTVDGMNTTVKGTSFNVRSYKGMSHQQVTVKTGHVVVDEPSGQIADLRPNDQVTFKTDKSNKFTESKVDADMVGSWRKGFVYLEGVTWSDFVQQVQLYYGYTIETDRRDLLRITELVTTLDLRQPVKITIERVADLYGAQYTIDTENRTIRL